MSLDAGRVLVMIVVIAVSAGMMHLLSGAQLFGLGIPEEATIATCSGSSVKLDGVRAELLKLHNEKRSEHGVPPLCWSEELARAATDHSEDMMERGFYAHDTPEGITPSERTAAAGYPSSFVTENIHRTYLSVGFDANVRDLRKTVRDWMESPGHRRNLLDPRLEEVGIGVAYGRFAYETDRSGTYTVNFGTRY